MPFLYIWCSSVVIYCFAGCATKLCTQLRNVKRIQIFPLISTFCDDWKRKLCLMTKTTSALCRSGCSKRFLLVKSVSNMRDFHSILWQYQLLLDFYCLTTQNGFSLKNSSARKVLDIADELEQSSAVLYPHGRIGGHIKMKQTRNVTTSGGYNMTLMVINWLCACWASWASFYRVSEHIKINSQSKVTHDSLVYLKRITQFRSRLALVFYS